MQILSSTKKKKKCKVKSLHNPLNKEKKKKVILNILKYLIDDINFSFPFLFLIYLYFDLTLCPCNVWLNQISYVNSNKF